MSSQRNLEDVMTETALVHVGRFASANGHTDIPPGHEEGSFALWQWVAQVRDDYHRGKVDDAVVEDLEMIEGWSWDSSYDGWERFFDSVKRTLERGGSMPVGSSMIAEWVSAQRKAQSLGRLSATKIARLEALPNWRWYPPAPAAAKPQTGDRSESA